MFNTTNNNTNTEIKTPATGIIQKSNEKSFFIRFHINSQRGTELLNDKPKYDEAKVCILQMMLMNDNNVLAEIVNIENL